jgi:hypothetical protein
VLKKDPKSTVLSELNELNVTKWQSEWDQTIKGATRKSFFPRRADRLKLKTNVTPSLTTMVTGHGNVKYICTNTKSQTAQCAPAKRRTNSILHIG